MNLLLALCHEMNWAHTKISAYMGANSASRRYSGSEAGATFNQVDARAVHPPVTSWNVVPRTRMRRSFKSTFEGGSTKCERRTCATACDLDAQTLRYFLWRQFPWLTFFVNKSPIKGQRIFRNHTKSLRNKRAWSNVCFHSAQLQFDWQFRI